MLVINYFGKMNAFVNFEAADDSNVNKIKGTEENMFENVSDVELVDDEDDFDKNLGDYYAFTNVSRSVEEGVLKTLCKILSFILIIHKK